MGKSVFRTGHDVLIEISDTGSGAGCVVTIDITCGRWLGWEWSAGLLPMRALRVASDLLAHRNRTEIYLELMRDNLRDSTNYLSDPPCKVVDLQSASLKAKRITLSSDAALDLAEELIKRSTSVMI